MKVLLKFKPDFQNPWKQNFWILFSRWSWSKLAPLSYDISADADGCCSLASWLNLLLAFDSSSHIFGPASWKIRQIRDSCPNASMGSLDSWFLILRAQYVTVENTGWCSSHLKTTKPTHSPKRHSLNSGNIHIFLLSKFPNTTSEDFYSICLRKRFLISIKKMS